MEQAKNQKYGTFFPYSHMSVSDLLNAAEASDNPLARVLAERLEEAADDVEGARKEAEDEGEKLREAEQRIRELEDEVDDLETALDEAKDPPNA